MASKKIPNGALRLVQTGEGCHAFAVEDEGGEKKLRMTVYSGGVIKNHWWWGNLAIDLSGMSFPKSKYPILENHDTNRKIAFTGKPLVGDDLTINPDKTKFVNTEESAEFQKLSAEGFPYESSMYAKPSAIERVDDGEKSEVNGFTFKGPGTIWRKCEFKEASVCVFGWDSQTVSSAFSKDILTEVEFEEMGGDETHTVNVNIDISKLEEVKEMPKTVKELREKYPELTTQLAEEVTNDLTQKFDEEKDVLKSENSKLSKTVEDQGKAIRDLQKDNLLSKERDMKKDADSIVSSKLSASDIPDRLHAKIRKLVNHNEFVKDDKLDIDAFSEAVDQEIVAFADLGITNTVLGQGSTQRTDEDPEALAKKKIDEEDDAAVDNMLKMAGQDPGKTKE